MDTVHKGKLLERAIRNEHLTVSQIAAALNVNRRTLYYWFKQENLDESIVNRVIDLMTVNIANTSNSLRLSIITEEKTSLIDDELYWQEKYIDLLERYTRLLTTKKP